MKIHEYQAKEILRKFGVPLLRGRVVDSSASAGTAAREIGLPVVVKSQIHAGGRGKGKIYAEQETGVRGKETGVRRQESGDRSQETGERELILEGGVKLAKTLEEAEELAHKILGNILVTHQTGPEGKKVKKVLVEKGCRIARELYLGATLDRASGRITFMASAEGGVEIEEVAAIHPEKIFKMPIDPTHGVDPRDTEVVAAKLGLKGPLSSQFVSLIKLLYETYLKTDCSLLEINPLVVTGEGELIALDAKVAFDDNALFRHADFESLRDLDEEDAGEIEARKYDLSYISLDGKIGCMVNGAGLAMATMDIIKLKGGEPANFLDVGGGATAEKVTAAFKIMLGDPKVDAILVNIFGGIMKCDVIAEGIVAAAREVQIKVPVVVRLQGTHVDLGKKILRESGLKLVSEDDFSKAAVKVVELSSLRA